MQRHLLMSMIFIIIVVSTINLRTEVRAEMIHYVNHNTCYQCRGSGNETCPVCGGTGVQTYNIFTNKTDPILDIISIICTQCLGRGTIVCTVCNGKGTLSEVSIPIKNK